MRGKAVYLHTIKFERRITPAYAGKRISSCWLISRSKDHPRVCGEKEDEILAAGVKAGSPPRMRGKVTVPRSVPKYTGITPAYAGKSILFRLVFSQAEDHPRVCGEKQRPENRYRHR